MTRRGFTLVELSIVLVIIGLLIGGILVAQSMITTTRVQAQVRQFQQLDAALNNFQTKFKQLPGDDKLFPTTFQDPSPIGDNNGHIETSTGDNTGTTRDGYPAFTGETSEVYRHLQLGVSLYKEYNFSDDYMCGGTLCLFSGPVIHMPPSMLNKNAGVMITYDSDWMALNFNAYIIAPFDVGSDAEESSQILKCADIAAIDQKIDDGNPGAGNVRPSACFATPTKYSLGPDDVSGAVEVKVMAQQDNN